MAFIKELLGGAAGAAIVGGVFGVIQWLLNRKAQKEDRAADRKAQKEDRAADRKAVDCAERGREIQILQANVNSLIVADRTILYDRIKHLAKSYIKRHWISVEEYEDLKRMHQVYHDDLKGNGFLDGIMEEVNQLEKRVI